MTTYERIYAVVKRIPRGRVATYGQVATLAGLRGRARQVGYALHATPPNVRIPWQRVVNAKGTISLRPGPGGALQSALLRAEGVDFDPDERIDLARFQWRPRGPREQTAKGRPAPRAGRKGPSSGPSGRNPASDRAPRRASGRASSGAPG